MMMVVRQHVAMMVVVVMATLLIHRLGLAVAEHHRLHHLAQRVFAERQVASEQAREPREHHRLHPSRS